MQIDFKALEQALAPIAEIGQGELTFDAGGTTITLRLLLPQEELAVQKYAAEAMEGETDSNSATDYIDRFRVSCLAHSVVAVGDYDFRGVDYVQTGETLGNGTPVKIPRVKALLTLIGRWSRPILVAAFKKYNELLNTVQTRVDKAVEFSPSDRDAEIERLEERLAELKLAKEEEAQKVQNQFAQRVDAVASAGEVQTMRESPGSFPARKPLAAADEDEEADEPEPARAPAPPPAPAPPIPVPRRAGPVIPQQAAPPPERGAVPPQGVVHVPPPTEAPPVPRAAPPRADSSFINAEDEDGMNAALAAEHDRLMDMRRRAAQGQRPQSDGSALDMVRESQPHLQQPRRRPPHQDAVETEAEVGFVGAAAQRARELGATPDGVPVFAMPVQDLDTPAARNRPDRGALNPQTQGGGSTNPRFQGPRKP